jgi:hypothetical protein
MLLVGAAAMTNVRRIHRYLTGKLRPAAAKQAAQAEVNAGQARSHRFRCAFLIPARLLDRLADGLACAHPGRLSLVTVPRCSFFRGVTD